MSRRRKTRVYWRNGRAYGDFRDYGDAGGSREALIPPGEKLATTDPDVADAVVGARLKELEAQRRRRGLGGQGVQASIGALTKRYLKAKRRAGYATRHVKNIERHLAVAAEFFRPGRYLDTIRVGEVREYLDYLRDQENPRGGSYTDSTLRAYLVSLSGLYTFAQEREVVPPGYNPVTAFGDKPSAAGEESEWLEVHDAARLIKDAQGSWIFPIVATMLLTGGRQSEVFGLTGEDVKAGRGIVHFRPNEYRGLKNKPSVRTVPLWPQLAEILAAHDSDSELLFPSPVTGEMLTNIRPSLDKIHAGLRTRIFRHTYCAARLQTLDHGAPVSVYTVAREMGHASTQTTERVYAHLGRVRHRSEVVEYRHR